MRFMMIVKASKQSEAGEMPSKELVEEMGRYNEELMKAGVLLSGEGLWASSEGAKVKFSGGKVDVDMGPFTDTKNLIAGFWMIKVNSRDEAIEWAKKCPPPHGPGNDTELELRRVFDTADFPPEVLSPEEAAKEEAMREELERRARKQ